MEPPFVDRYRPPPHPQWTVLAAHAVEYGAPGKTGPPAVGHATNAGLRADQELVYHRAAIAPVKAQIPRNNHAKLLALGPIGEAIARAMIRAALAG